MSGVRGGGGVLEGRAHVGSPLASQRHNSLYSDRSGALGTNPRLIVDMAFGPPVVSEFDVPRSFSDPHLISALSVCSPFLGTYR